MDNLTKEEVISMLYGMIWIGGLTRTEKEILQAAIDYLEKESDGA